MRAPVPTGDRGACPADRVCSAPPSATCVICVSDAQCSGATPVCDTTTNTCRAAPDAAVDASADVIDDVTSDVAEAGLDAAPDVMDATVPPDVMMAPDVMTAPDVMMAPDVMATTDVVTPRDVSIGTMDGGLTIAYRGGGCGCSTRGRSSDRSGALAGAFVALAVTARRRRRSSRRS